MSHTLSAPLLSRLSSLSAELSELCGLCDLLADPMPRNFIQASLRTLSDMAEDASETLGQFADATRGSKRRILPALLDGYTRDLALVPPLPPPATRNSGLPSNGSATSRTSASPPPEGWLARS